MTAHARIPADSLSERSFQRISDLVRAASGIQLPRTKLTMVEGRLKRLALNEGSDSVEDYCERLLAAAPGSPPHTALINAITTNKTDFFREPKHFEHLTGTVLRIMASEARPSIRVWSAACSTGAEPYTLAMILETARRAGGPAWSILATDLDTDVLRTAQRGVYPTDVLAPVPRAMQDEFIHPALDPARREVRIAPVLRNRIRFARLNLMDSRYQVSGPMDVVFCRNVLIYFDKPTQEKVVRKLSETMAPGGHIYLGHSESITGYDVPLTQVGNTIFQKVS